MGVSSPVSPKQRLGTADRVGEVTHHTTDASSVRGPRDRTVRAIGDKWRSRPSGADEERRSASCSGATGDRGRIAHHYEEQAEVGLHSACRKALGVWRTDSAPALRLPAGSPFRPSPNTPAVPESATMLVSPACGTPPVRNRSSTEFRARQGAAVHAACAGTTLHAERHRTQDNPAFVLRPRSDDPVPASLHETLHLSGISATKKILSLCFHSERG